MRIWCGLRLFDTSSFLVIRRSLKTLPIIVVRRKWDSAHLCLAEIELVNAENNYALKLRYVWNRMTKTSWRSIFPGDWTGLFWQGLTKHLWLKIWSDLLFCGTIFKFVTFQQFLHMYYMGYIKIKKYKFPGSPIKPSHPGALRFGHIW